MIARRRVGTVLDPDGGSIADEEAASGPRDADACSAPGQAAKVKSQVPVWREGLAWSVLCRWTISASFSPSRTGIGSIKGR